MTDTISKAGRLRAHPGVLQIGGAASGLAGRASGSTLHRSDDSTTSASGSASAILKDVSSDESGQIAAIVGPLRRGKSEIAGLNPRSYIRSGTVRITGATARATR